MDNRFNLKDIVVIVLLLGLGLLIYLSMVQKQRQWGVLQKTLSEMKDQRESVQLYKRELNEYKRGQDALRGGVQQLIEQLKQGSATGGLSTDADITLDTRDFEDDPTFERVAGLKDRPDYAEGDYFIDAFSTTVKSLTPYIAGDIYASRIGQYVMETLITVDLDTLEYKPWIAESWEVSDDGLTITYHMRKDVVFSDGHPLDAHDVVFTYEWIMNPKVNAPRMRQTYFDKFEYVKALDDHTVQFKYREPYFMALTVTGMYLEILPEHWIKQFSEDEYNTMPGLLVGSGPYKLVENPKTWEPGSGRIELERNENYWGPRPALDRVIWREIQDDTARLTQMRNRQIDRFTVVASMYRTLSADEQLRRQADLYEYEYVSSGYLYIGWNQQKNGRPTPFADKRVRQAMTLLVDRQGICSGVFDNLASPASGPFHPLGWQGDPTIEPWPYDPERAKKLLTEAGYIDRDGDGQRESPEGVPFTFAFIYSANSAESKDTALRIKESMRKAGVEVTLDPLDWPAMQQKLDDQTFDAIFLGWGGAVDSDLFQMFHSSQVSEGGNNYTAHKNAELDRAIERARSIVDRDACQAAWQEVHRMLHDQQPYTFMFNRKSVMFVDKRVRNLEITSVGPNLAYEYYVPAPLQLHTGE